ncbi:MAG: formylglycine-generating enzyme family protein [Calditrichaeota bacterium]|nr:formylglycine-generating enzyme family protein [Calditrichota bacterium]
MHAHIPIRFGWTPLAACLLASLWISCDDDSPVNHAPEILGLGASQDTLSIPLLGFFNDLVTLSGSARDDDGDRIRYRWTAPGGVLAEGDSLTTVLWQAPPIAGSYTIELRVDDGSLVARDSLQVVVLTPEGPGRPTANMPPEAEFCVTPASGVIGTRFTLDASSSSDPETPLDSLYVRWDLDDDGIWDTDWSREKGLEFVPERIGLQSVRLQVRDEIHFVHQVGHGIVVGSAGPHEGIEMVTLPTGQFLMGQSGDPDGGTEHLETIARFSLGLTEVSNWQYLQALNWALEQGRVTISGQSVRSHGRVLLLLNRGPTDLPEIGHDPESGQCYLQTVQGIQGEIGPGLADPQGYDPADRPVQFVSWFGAACFCDWLSEIQGLPPFYQGSWTRAVDTAPGYRLPMEKEWEYAAQYPDDRIHPWGNAAPTCELAVYTPVEPCAVWPRNVGSLPAGASELGLLDMAGNLREWCTLWPRAGPPPTDTSHASSRGGAFDSAWRDLKCFHRQTSQLSSTVHGTGFRVCRTLP